MLVAFFVASIWRAPLRVYISKVLIQLEWYTVIIALYSRWSFSPLWVPIRCIFSLGRRKQRCALLHGLVISSEVFVLVVKDWGWFAQTRLVWLILFVCQHHWDRLIYWLTSSKQIQIGVMIQVLGPYIIRWNLRSLFNALCVQVLPVDAWPRNISRHSSILWWLHLSYLFECVYVISAYSGSGFDIIHWFKTSKNDYITSLYSEK